MVKRIYILFILVSLSLIIAGCTPVLVANEAQLTPPHSETITPTETPTFTVVPTTAPTTTPTTTPTTLPTATPVPGKWQVYADTSVFDGSTTVTISEIADNPVYGRKKNSYTPELFILCQDKNLQIVVNVGMDFDVEAGLYGQSTVRLRFDEGEEFYMVTSQLPDGEAIYISNPEDTLGKLLKAEKFIFGFNPYRAYPAFATFDLTGLAAAVTPVLEACK